MGERFYQPRAEYSRPCETQQPIQACDVYRDSCDVQPANRQAFEAQIDKTFGKQHCITDKDNYRENLFSSAENKKPVVMMFGRGSSAGSPDFMESMARAKQQAGGKADFMYVDLDKVDRNSPIGQYARDHIGRDFGTPLVMVFTQKQGEGRTPVIPERPMHYQLGYVDERKLASAISQAAQIQSTRDIKTGREKKQPDAPPVETDQPVKPEQGDKPAKPATAQDLLKESVKPWDQQKNGELLKGMKPEEQLKLYWDAIKLADEKQNPKLSAQMRAMVGFASIGWGAEADAKGNKEEAQKHYLRGGEYMMSAGALNPDLFKYPNFTERLRNSALPGNAANAIIERGLSTPDAKWFYPSKEETQKNPNAFPDAREKYMQILTDEMKKPKAQTKPVEQRRGRDPYDFHGEPKQRTALA